MFDGLLEDFWKVSENMGIGNIDAFENKDSKVIFNLWNWLCKGICWTKEY